MSSFYHHQLDKPVADDQAGSVIAIGNFDGVHRGHQVVLEQALAIARDKGVQCFALSFEPHPRTLFNPDSPVFRLTEEPLKARVLQAFGVDGLLVLEFTRDLAGTSAEDFVKELLVGRARASHVVSGFNFHFGKNRAGSPDFLRQAGQTFGFGVTIVDAKTDEGGDNQDNGPDIISSSRIRRLLGAGDVDAAAQLLGYRWLVSGKVIKGAQLGRTLNYPTANLELAQNCHLAHGIYAVHLRTADGSLHHGVASYGRRPTFDNGRALLETFIFDFDRDIYGEEISVTLLDYLRPELKFESAGELVIQMDKDSLRARQCLANSDALSELDAALNFGAGVQANG
ncbi:MAG: bifunctional riboflavin kinase/FAD synthetase [Rhizobiaceae bacterium]